MCCGIIVSMQGCNHDRGTANECSSSSYNYGYRDPQAMFRTILAYECQAGQCDGNVGGTCPVIQRFSSPNGLYNGKAIGNALNDNTRQLNDVVSEVEGEQKLKYIASNRDSPSFFISNNSFERKSQSHIQVTTTVVFQRRLLRTNLPQSQNPNAWLAV